MYSLRLQRVYRVDALFFFDQKHKNQALRLDGIITRRSRTVVLLFSAEKPLPLVLFILRRMKILP